MDTHTTILKASPLSIVGEPQWLPLKVCIKCMHSFTLPNDHKADFSFISLSSMIGTGKIFSKSALNTEMIRTSMSKPYHSVGLLMEIIERYVPSLGSEKGDSWEKGGWAFYYLVEVAAQKFSITTICLQFKFQLLSNSPILPSQCIWLQPNYQLNFFHLHKSLASIFQDSTIRQGIITTLSSWDIFPNSLLFLYRKLWRQPVEVLIRFLYICLLLF